MNRPPQTVFVSDGSKVYWFDAVIKAQHTSSLKIEDNPANAKGDKYTNSASIEPKELALDISMSDCISTMDDLTTGSGTRSVNAHNKLVDLQRGRTLLGVSTRLFGYTRMLIKSIVATEDETNPEGVTASITFREVLEPAAKKKKGGGGGNDHQQNKGDTQTQPKDESSLFDMFGDLTRLILGPSTPPPKFGADGDVEVHYPN